MQRALVASIAALALLGLIGGCFVLAAGGFTSSNKAGTWKVFVPLPQAFIMVAIMFAMSGLAVLWLVQQARLGRIGQITCAFAYVLATFLTTRLLSQALA